MENIEKYLADGFWKDHYSEEIKKNKNGELYVPLKYLEQESNIVIFDHNVDCEPFAYMKNLNEASFCNCKLSNISILAKYHILKGLVLQIVLLMVKVWQHFLKHQHFQG